MAGDLEHQQTLDATLRAVVALLDKQALVHQLVARTDTRKHALVQSLVERQHAVELEKKLNQLHPADAAFVLESLRQEQRMTAWQLISRERRGAVLLELADAVRASLVTLLEEPELIGLGRQMDAEDFADLVQDLPQERVDAVLAQLGSAERAEVQSVLSFPEGSVGALMQLDVVTVRADVTLENAIASLRRRGSLPPQLTSLTVVDRNNVLQGTLPIDQLLVRDGALDGQPRHGRGAEVFSHERPRGARRRGVRALRPDRGARRESAQAGRRHADRRQGARAGQAGLVQAVVEPSRLERGRGLVRADLAERPQASRVARAESA